MSFKTSAWAFLLALCAGSGSALAQDPISPEQLAAAEKIFDLQFTPVKRDSIISGLSDHLHLFQYMHQQDLPNDLSLSLSFDPALPGMRFNHVQNPLPWDRKNAMGGASGSGSSAGGSGGGAGGSSEVSAGGRGARSGAVKLPANRNALAFYSIPQLASLLYSRQISSVELVKFFLERLKKFGPELHCVIELLEDSALAQARRADADLARGVYKSPLQGIPYGIKDLFAVKGSHTTWGSPPYRDQVIMQTSFVAQQLAKAGAVLLAKLSLGELAMDDVWYGGLTRNPWDMTVGSGGSSAGSASATSAGLVPFAIGTETYGSIVDPSMRCGATGLRPTFGSIARTGCMALCWSSDKAGPICRSAEDAAYVFAYIHGTDGIDASARQMPFNYTGRIDLSKLKIAYTSNYIDTLPESSPEKQTLAVLRRLGAKVEPLVFPDDLRGNDILSLIIGVESAAAFDKLTRSNQDDEMVQQNKDRWPNTFRTARFIPAVEYVNACRLRTAIMQKVDPILSRYDIIIAPPETGDQLAITNLTGHPSVTLPAGEGKNGLPGSISFIAGHLYDEARLLAFAKAFQDATPYNKRHPKHFE